MVTTQHKHLAISAFLSFSALLLLSFVPIPRTMVTTPPDEICDNAIDDDGDGLIDLNDPDCECEVIEPVSLIPNPSFEDMNCCPSDRSQLHCADAWIQASEPTTDFLHTCGWMGWDDFPPPLPFPDGQGVMGFRDGRVRQNGGTPEKNWKEYAGACLLSPLEAGTTYLFEFYVGFVNTSKSPPINITFFGSTDCDNLPFGAGDEAFGCPTNGPGWVKLGSSSAASGSSIKWVKTSIEVVPEEDITAIVIGPECAGTQSIVSTFYFFDNLVLADLQSFQFVITEVSHPCSAGFLLKVPEEPDFSYQWYKDGIALIGETQPQLAEMHGEGDYQVRIQDEESCKVSSIYPHTIPIFTQPVTKIICEEDEYPFGDLLLNESGFYVDTFKTVNNCDSIVYLDLTVLGRKADTVSAQIFEGESYSIDPYSFTKEGDHLVNLVSSQGCDSLVLLQLKFYHVFIPNVFSPNDDGINDLFQVFGGEGLIELRKLTIFDRWGAQVYQGIEWDGRYKGNFVDPGVFTYIARLKMDDGIERQFAGSVTVIR